MYMCQCIYLYMNLNICVYACMYVYKYESMCSYIYLSIYLYIPCKSATGDVDAMSHVMSCHNTRELMPEVS